MKRSKLLSLLLSMTMALSLTACGTGNEPAASSTPPATTAPAETETTSVPEGVTTRLTVLNGPTGVGAAQLLSDIDAGTAAQDYSYEIVSANDEVVSMLTSGETDIAAMATNVALNLYNKTEGGITMLALNTLGVLYILEGNGGTSVNSVSDLSGKTILAPGQGANPEYVLNYILTQNGLTPGEDVTIEWKTAEEITQAMLAGTSDVCMLPVPAATACIAKSEGKVRAALDLTEEWDALGTDSTLTMGCIVARTEFVAEHPEAVDAFLTEYAASIAAVSGDPQGYGSVIEAYGLAPSAAIATKAIPQCHLVCITGSDMISGITGYYQVLFDANPTSIGGSLPDDAFYYVP